MSCKPCGVATAIGMYLSICQGIKELDCKEIEDKVLNGKMKPEDAFILIKSKAKPEDKEILDAIDEELSKYGKEGEKP